MSNKRKDFKKGLFLTALIASVFSAPAFAEDELMEELSAESIAAYKVDGSLFQQITGLEQEKILMQLEKERAQLDLELDRLAAEKIKLHMEIDTLSGRAEEQQLALETEKAKLEAETARLEREKQALLSQADTDTKKPATPKKSVPDNVSEDPVSQKYRLVDIIGAGNQLQATVEDLGTGQRKKISVGKILDGYVIQSISLDEGVVFVKDDVVEMLNISKES